MDLECCVNARWGRAPLGGGVAKAPPFHSRPYTVWALTENGAGLAGCVHVSAAELIDRKGGSWRYRTPRRAAPAPCPLTMVVRNVSWRAPLGPESSAAAT